MVDESMCPFSYEEGTGLLLSDYRKQFFEEVDKARGLERFLVRNFKNSWIFKDIKEDLAIKLGGDLEYVGKFENDIIEAAKKFFKEDLGVFGFIGKVVENVASGHPEENGVYEAWERTESEERGDTEED